MKPVIALVATVLAVGFLTIACGDGNQQDAAVPVGGASASGQGVEVTLKSEPDPPKTGDNAFDVMVTSGGQPVTDADVSVEFFMPAMPAMNMAEMRNTVALTHAGGGRYSGTGNVMMAGNWDVTVSVKRGGQTIGSQKFPVTAR